MPEGVIRAHVIIGGYPHGSHAGHDHDYVRVQALSILQQFEHVHATVSVDFNDIEKWLPDSDFLFTYVAGPYADGEENEVLQRWLEQGGRWVGIHGTSGGRTKRVGENRAKQMVKMPFHHTLGAFFINHEPIRRFEVSVADRDHPLTRGLPATFETTDEPYMIEVLDPSARVLLTNALGPDSTPPGGGFYYEQDTTLLDDGVTRVLAYVRSVGQGEVAYIALGHTHTPTTNIQRRVHENVSPDQKPPLYFRGSWDVDAFRQLFRNALEWGIGANVAEPATAQA